MKIKTTAPKPKSLRSEIKRQELKVRTAEVKLEIEKCKLAMLRKPKRPRRSPLEIAAERAINRFDENSHVFSCSNIWKSCAWAMASDLRSAVSGKNRIRDIPLNRVHIYPKKK